MSVRAYTPRRAWESPLYHAVAEHLATFLADRQLRGRPVPFSCKGRGFCPSCCGRRMAETAARLVDQTLPEAPVRQWVLTVPHVLRFLPALRPFRWGRRPLRTPVPP